MENPSYIALAQAREVTDHVGRAPGLRAGLDLAETVAEQHEIKVPMRDDG